MSRSLPRCIKRILVSQIPGPYVAEAVSHYGPCLVKLGRSADAEQPLREAERRFREPGQSQTDERPNGRTIWILLATSLRWA